MASEYSNPKPELSSQPKDTIQLILNNLDDSDSSSLAQTSNNMKNNVILDRVRMQKLQWSHVIDLTDDFYDNEVKIEEMGCVILAFNGEEKDAWIRALDSITNTPEPLNGKGQKSLIKRFLPEHRRYYDVDYIPDFENEKTYPIDERLNRKYKTDYAEMKKGYNEFLRDVLNFQYPEIMEVALVSAGFLEILEIFSRDINRNKRMENISSLIYNCSTHDYTKKYNGYYYQTNGYCTNEAVLLLISLFIRAFYLRSDDERKKAVHNNGEKHIYIGDIIKFPVITKTMLKSGVDFLEKCDFLTGVLRCVPESFPWNKKVVPEEDEDESSSVEESSSSEEELEDDKCQNLDEDDDQHIMSMRANELSYRFCVKKQENDKDESLHGSSQSEKEYEEQKNRNYTEQELSDMKNAHENGHYSKFWLNMSLFSNLCIFFTCDSKELYEFIINTYDEFSSTFSAYELSIKSIFDSISGNRILEGDEKGVNDYLSFVNSSMKNNQVTKADILSKDLSKLNESVMYPCLNKLIITYPRLLDNPLWSEFKTLFDEIMM